MFRAFNGKGFSIMFENGWTASVQFGVGNYCSNQFGENGRESNTAEIAAYKGDEWHQFETDQVKGWVNPKEVLEFLNMVAAKV